MEVVLEVGEQVVTFKGLLNFAGIKLLMLIVKIKVCQPVGILTVVLGFIFCNHLLYCIGS